MRPNPSLSRGIPTLAEVILRIIAFNPVACSGNLYAKYAEACERAAAVAAEMQRIAQAFFHFSVEIPELLPVPTEAAQDGKVLRTLMKANIRMFAEQLAEQWRHDRIGDLEVFDNGACRFHYYEFSTGNGLLTRKTEATRVEHDVINARFLRWEASSHVEKTKRANDIFGATDLLRPYIRIVTGIEIVRGIEKAETISERTRAGRAVDRSSRFLKDHWKETAATAGLGILGAVGTYAYMAAAAAAASVAPAAIATVSAVAIADPAMAIGERILTGWD